MSFLLDTSTFLWAMQRSPRISLIARRVLDDKSSRLLLSIVSIWEIAIKVSLGKLKAPDDIQNILPLLGLDLLPISVDHIAHVKEMPFHHRDPFDRMLVAQAQHENAVLITNDPIIAKYGVPVLW